MAEMFSIKKALNKITEKFNNSPKVNHFSFPDKVDGDNAVKLLDFLNDLDTRTVTFSSKIVRRSRQC